MYNAIQYSYNYMYNINIYNIHTNILLLESKNDLLQNN